MKLFTLDKNGVMKQIKVDEHKEVEYRYALTLNICGHDRVNKKLWCMYTKDRQEEILFKKLNAFCRGTDHRVAKVVIETCPNSGQRHIHALIYGPQPIKSKYVEVINRPYIRDYKTFKIDEIYDELGWQHYLNKDQYHP